MISVSFGADITTWGYLNYVKKYNFFGGISQPCPTVVGYIEHYVPENNISGPSCKDEIEYGLGSVYPMPGGLKENVYWFLGEDAFIRQCEGEGHLRQIKSV